MSGSYNMNISATEAKRLWFNYYYQNNSYGTSASTIGAISNAYSENLPEWKALAEKAENGDIVDYDIDSDDMTDGANQAKEYSGYDNSTGDNVDKWVEVGVNGIAAGGTAVLSYTNAGQKFATNLSEGILGTTMIEKGGKKASEKAAKKSGEEAGKEAGKKAMANVGIIISCAADLTSWSIYKATDPNAESVEASIAYGESMPDKQAECVNNETEIATLGADLNTATEEAYENCEDANSYMADNMTDVGLYEREIEYFERAETSGYEHSQEDIEAYKEAVEYIQALSDDNDIVTEEIESATAEKYEEMAGAQDTFDEKVTDIANIEGYSNEAQNVADGAQFSSNVEGVLLTAEGAMSGFDAIKAGSLAISTGWCGLGIAYGLAAAAATAAVIGDGIGATKEFKNADECGKVSDACGETKRLNDKSLETLNKEFENYQVNMDTMECLTIEKPDIEIPEEIEISTNPDSEQTSDGTTSSSNKNKNKKP